MNRALKVALTFSEPSTTTALVLHVAPHPLLDLGAFVTELPRPLGELTTAPATLTLLRAGAAAPMTSDDQVRAAVRELLRHGGYKPTGRGKPASEYLLRAVAEGALGAINPVVDVCNVVSLHSGLPISVVDLERATPPLQVAIAPAGARYVFNASGQEIDIAGLVCLFDQAGPCANGVKDSQRTKTSPATRRTLSLVWGTHALPGRTAATVRWYQELLAAHGATTAAP